QLILRLDSSEIYRHNQNDFFEKVSLNSKEVLMTFQEKKLLWLITVGLTSLGGCEAPQGGHYNKAAHDAPAYDSAIYMPKYPIEPSYDHAYYHDDIPGGRQ
ncbi:MAG: hypothetical protein K0R76_746, partial [Alphaproteobacteria bacterium]|nr:hypothetical protein [Alphaproteobacteria bacterium]